MFMSNSEREQYLNDNPNIIQVLDSFPAINSGGVIGKKPDDAFRDKLKEIKKAHSKGYTKRNKSTVNTF